MKKNLIIDGNNILNRAFYALPILSNGKGEYLNAVYGFCNMLVRYITQHAPDRIFVAFDWGKKTFRHDLYADYKAGRGKTPDELVFQFPLAKQVLDAMNIKYLEIPQIEADDIIGSLAQKLDGHNYILSGDKDVLQLVNDNTTVLLARKGITNVEEITPQNIEEMFGFSAHQVVDFKSLCGDSSDNIPGVLGIGEKTAKSLLQKYKSLDKIYENLGEISGKLNEKLATGKESAYMSKLVATIKTDCELGEIDGEYQFPFGEDVKKLFERFEFDSLLKKQELFLDSSQQTTTEVCEISNPQQCEEFFSDAKCVAARWGDEELFVARDDQKQHKILLENLKSNPQLQKNVEKFFKNSEICKIVYDKKTFLHQMNNLKMCQLNNVFDISIASYLICSTQKFEEEKDVTKFFKQKQNLQDGLRDSGMEKLYYEMELPLCDVLFDMEMFGIKIDQHMLEKLRAEISQQLEELKHQIWQCAGQTFNVNSSKQLATILFDKLAIKCPQKKQSTASEVLLQIQHAHPIVALVMRQRKLQKLLSGYIESYHEIIQKSGDVIHTVFNQTLTATGRLSSSEPNLQNLPIREEEGRALRALFVSQFDGGLMTSADYNQIELRLLAHLSEDENLISAFNKGEDVHKSTAQKIYGKTEITSSERRHAKAVNFGIIYGISDYGLAKQLGIFRKDAKSMIEKYFEIYPQIMPYLQNNIKFAKENGYCQTILGRRRYISELTSPNFSVRSFGERVAMNMPLQGSASDIIKLAMLKVFDAIKQKGLRSKLVLQIHDELVVDTHPNEVEDVKKILKECMENVIMLRLKLPVEVSSGKNLMECK